MAINMNNAVMLPGSLGGSLSDQPLFSVDLRFQHLVLTQSSVRPIAAPSTACLLIPFSVATHLNACMLYVAHHLPRISGLTILEFDELIRDTASQVTRAARTEFHVRGNANPLFSYSPPSMVNARTVTMEDTITRAAPTEFYVRVHVNPVFSYSPPSMVNAGTVTTEDTMILEEMFAGEPRDRTGASSTALERLKKETFCFDSDAGTESGTCVVCLEELFGGAFLTSMPCSHTFHESCIFEWLKNANSCPLCRCELEDD